MAGGPASPRPTLHRVEPLKDHLDAGDLKKIAAFGLKHPVILAIAVAVVPAINVFVALWAPADLIVADALGPTTLDLVQLTSVNYPLPDPSEHITRAASRSR